MPEGQTEYAGLLTEVQKKVARLSALGLDGMAICAACGITKHTYLKWSKLPLFLEYKRNYMEQNHLAIEELLLEGEKYAAIALLEAMQAKKDDNVDWEVRLKAAFRFLDAMGRRGKPVEVVESKNLELKGDLNELFKNALRDPGIQKLLGTGQITLPVGMGQGPQPVPLQGEIARDGRQPFLEGEFVVEGIGESTSDSGAGEEGPESVHPLPGEADSVRGTVSGSESVEQATGDSNLDTETPESSL